MHIDADFVQLERDGRKEREWRWGGWRRERWMGKREGGRERGVEGGGREREKGEERENP